MRKENITGRADKLKEHPSVTSVAITDRQLGAKTQELFPLWEQWILGRN